MPRLKTFGRFKAFGSDDLTAPYTLEALFYSAWYFYTYSIVLMAGGLLISLCIIRISLLGTVINAYPRRHIGSFLAIKLCWDGLTTLILLGATWHTYRASPVCSEGHPDVYLSGVWSALKGMWIVTVAVLLGLWHRVIALSATGVDESRLTCSNLETEVTVQSELFGSWRNRLMSFGVDEHTGLDELSTFLSTFFKEDVNVVPTDILTCLVLLEQQEKARKLNPTATGLDPHVCSPQPWMTVENAVHFLTFASAAFGWPMFVALNPFAVGEMFRILKLRSTLSKQSLFSEINADDPWLLNTAVIYNTTGISISDLIHVSYHNKLFEVPFFVAADHTTKSVVVSVRGTMSMKDVMTDLMAYPSEPLVLPGISDVLVHSGILHAAQYLENRLFGDNGQDGLMELAMQRVAEHVGADSAKEYKLVLTGDSLGAGIVSVLALLIYSKRKPHRNLQCFAFSAPGGTMSLSASRFCQTFVCSVAMGDDIISKLSICSGFSLKIRLLNVLLNCDIPKHAIVRGWLFNWVSQIVGGSRTYISPDGKEDRPTIPSWSGDVNAAAAVECYQAKLESAIEATIAERAKHERLYLPGCILYITETVLKRSILMSETLHSFEFLDAEHELFANVVISSKMIAHHNPWIVQRALRSIN